MKQSIKLIIIILMSVMTSAAAAKSPEKYFDKFSENSGFDYSYMSPQLMKAFGERPLDTGDNIIAYHIRASSVNSIECIKTGRNGADKDLWTIIRKLIKDKNLDSLSTTKRGYSRSDILGKISDNGKVITDLLVIVQDGADNLTLVYIIGKIPLEEIGRLSF